MMYQQQQQDIQMMNTPGYNPGYPPQQQQQPTAPPPYSQVPSSVPQDQIRENQFRDIVNRYEISLPFSSKLQKLNMFKIVFIFDDSGSMNATLEESPLNKGLIKATRWDELKYFSQISIDIANIFNQEAGTDVYFLNRPMARGVRSSDDLVPYMVSRPNGYTPLARVLGTVLSNNSPQFLGEKKLLVIIVTDGEPTDDGGRSDIPGFKQCLQMRSNKTYTTIVSCTDEDDTMTYLNNWDRTIPRLDVVDDYRSEKEEILRANGRSYRFSFGDYVVKSLIGSIDPSLDNVDEVQHQSSECCTII